MTLLHLKFRPVKVPLREEGSGLLVFIDGWLVAVLVRLADHHGTLAGQWFLETGYGRFSEGEAPVFADETSAAAWFRSSLADQRLDDPW